MDQRLTGHPGQAQHVPNRVLGGAGGAVHTMALNRLSMVPNLGAGLVGPAMIPHARGPPMMFSNPLGVHPQPHYQHPPQQHQQFVYPMPSMMPIMVQAAPSSYSTIPQHHQPQSLQMAFGMPSQGATMMQFAPASTTTPTQIPAGLPQLSSVLATKDLSPAVSAMAGARSAAAFHQVILAQNNRVPQSQLQQVRSSKSSTPKRQRPSNSSASSSASKRRATNLHEDEDSPMCGLGGEHRLTIHFQSTGSRGQWEPQTFGKSKYLIPDGLTGTHRMYSQDWKFEITHHLVKLNDEDPKARDVVVLQWAITNLASGSTVALTETPQEAILRQTKGNTICNTVLRKALEARIQELHTDVLKNDKSPLQVANLRSLIKELCPKKCAQGVLFFGLRHEIVQAALGNLRGNHGNSGNVTGEKVEGSGLSSSSSSAANNKAHEQQAQEDDGDTTENE